jgi:hypothetical protein
MARTLALALILTPLPACETLNGRPSLVSPAPTNASLDQKAYAALAAYAAVLEEGAALVANPSVPLAFKRALGEVEARATPAANTLEIALSAYLRARAQYDALTGADAGDIQRAGAAITAAGVNLAAALRQAEAPIVELKALMARKPR